MALTVLDAGPIIAVLNAADPRHEASIVSLEHAEQRGDMLVVSASAYAELLVHPARRGPAATESVDEYLAAMPVSVEPISRSTAREAAGLRAKHGKRLPLPDALVVATALELGADRIITTDRGWPKK